MAQSSDIVLNGDPYMIVGKPGYVRAQDGMDEGRARRLVQTDFFGGSRRAIQLERDRFFSSHEVGPALGGQGVTAWPFKDTITLPAAADVGSAANEYPHCLIRDHMYFAVNTKLFKSASLSAGIYNPPTMIYDAGVGNRIWSIIPYGWNILLSFGTTKEITHGVYPDFTTPAILFAGSYGYHMVPYQGFAIWADARASGTGYQNMVQMVTGTGIQSRRTADPIIRVTTAQGEVTLATKTAIYTYGGRVGQFTIPNGTPPPDNVEVERWTGDLDPFFQHGTATFADDYRFIVGFGGRTYAWLGGLVLEHDPNGERAGWRDTGLGGRRCFGACVVAGYLVVSLISHAGMSEVWAWDGSGWWCVTSIAEATATYLTPIPLGGLDGLDVMLPRLGSRDTQVLRLVHRSNTQTAVPAIAANPHIVSSMLDADERDKRKAWRKVGAVFSSPAPAGNVASTDVVTVNLDYSLDGGGIWTPAGTFTTATNSLFGNQFTISTAIASSAVSVFLMLRVRWISTFDWAPILTGLWAECEVIDDPARRRRWTFTVQAEDQVIDRDGKQLLRSGRQQISELWNHWQAAQPIPFRDLDYDTVPTERLVRIIGIHEAVPVPHQAANWGQSAVTLSLVEM